MKCLGKGNVLDTITILRIITFKLTPKNYNDRVFKFYEHYYGGQSFLLNPEKLLDVGRSYSDKEVVEYAGVASFRNYFEYQQTKDSTLDLLMLPISEDIITKKLHKFSARCLKFKIYSSNINLNLIDFYQNHTLNFDLPFQCYTNFD